MESHGSQIRIVTSRSGQSSGGSTAHPIVRRRLNVRLHVPSREQRTPRLPRVLRVGRFILGGDEPRHELPLIDIGLTRTCITFPRGTRLEIGEIFEIVRPVRVRADIALPSGGLRKVVALVKIVGLENDVRARVDVLGGSLRGECGRNAWTIIASPEASTASRRVSPGRLTSHNAQERNRRQ